METQIRMTGYIHCFVIKVIQEGMMTVRDCMVGRNIVKQQVKFMQ